MRCHSKVRTSTSSTGLSQEMQYALHMPQHLLQNPDIHSKAELLQAQACDVVERLAAPQVCAAIMMSSLSCTSRSILLRTLYSCRQT